MYIFLYNILYHKFSSTVVNFQISKKVLYKNMEISSNLVTFAEIPKIGHEAKLDYLQYMKFDCFRRSLT